MVDLLALHTDDNRRWSPEQMAEFALKDSPEFKSAILILCDIDGDGVLTFQDYYANVNRQQAISICEIVKQNHVLHILDEQ